jgi:hypothetical protein
MKGARPSLMGALLKLGIRKAGDGKGMVGPDSVKEENQNNLLVDDKGTARPDSVKEGSQTHLLVATLIATVTFTAAFTVPGGYQNQGVDEGLAVLSKRASFRAFLIANTLAFGLSITSILVHFFASLRGGWCRFSRKHCGSTAPLQFLYLHILCYYSIAGSFYFRHLYSGAIHSLGITVAVFSCIWCFISCGCLFLVGFYPFGYTMMY